MREILETDFASITEGARLIFGRKKKKLRTSTLPQGDGIVRRETEYDEDRDTFLCYFFPTP